MPPTIAEERNGGAKDGDVPPPSQSRTEPEEEEEDGHVRARVGKVAASVVNGVVGNHEEIIREREEEKPTKAEKRSTGRVSAKITSRTRSK